MSDLFVEKWRDAARELGLEIEAPFSLRLPSGAEVRARLLLKHFGGERGMFIVTDWAVLEPHWKEVVDAGFGFSTLSEPSPGEVDDREAFLEMLRDWGWAGPEALRPAWLDPP